MLKDRCRGRRCPLRGWRCPHECLNVQMPLQSPRAGLALQGTCFKAKGSAAFQKHQSLDNAVLIKPSWPRAWSFQHCSGSSSPLG